MSHLLLGLSFISDCLFGYWFSLLALLHPCVCACRFFDVVRCLFSFSVRVSVLSGYSSSFLSVSFLPALYFALVSLFFFSNFCYIFFSFFLEFLSDSFLLSLFFGLFVFFVLAPLWVCLSPFMFWMLLTEIAKKKLEIQYDPTVKSPSRRWRLRVAGQDETGWITPGTGTQKHDKFASGLWSQYRCIVQLWALFLMSFVVTFCFICQRRRRLSMMKLCFLIFKLNRLFFSCFPHISLFEECSSILIWECVGLLRMSKYSSPRRKDKECGSFLDGNAWNVHPGMHAHSQRSHTFLGIPAGKGHAAWVLPLFAFFAIPPFSFSWFCLPSVVLFYSSWFFVVIFHLLSLNTLSSLAFVSALWSLIFVWCLCLLLLIRHMMTNMPREY